MQGGEERQGVSLTYIRCLSVCLSVSLVIKLEKSQFEHIVFY